MLLQNDLCKDKLCLNHWPLVTEYFLLKATQAQPSTPGKGSISIGKNNGVSCSAQLAGNPYDFSLCSWPVTSFGLSRPCNVLKRIMGTALTLGNSLRLGPR